MTTKLFKTGKQLLLGIGVYLLCAATPSFVYSQSSNEVMRNYLEKDDYKALLTKYQDAITTLDAEGLYYMAVAALYTEQVDRALDYATKTIALAPDISSPYMLSAECYFQKQEFDKAIAILQKAIQVDPENVEVLGRTAYLYSEKKEPLLAMEYYKEILKISKDVPDLRAAYSNSLFNTALLIMDTPEKATAELYLIELLYISPKDYAAMAKLIQIYYHQQAFDKVAPLREQLYYAHKNDELAETDLADMFCIDQYQLGSNNIQVFERFQEEPNAAFGIFYKHIAYIDGDNEHSIQTEYTYGAKQEKKATFLLGMDKSNKHYTFPIGLPKDYKHQDFKRLVAQILQGEIQPAASSVKKKNNLL